MLKGLKGKCIKVFVLQKSITIRRQKKKEKTSFKVTSCILYRLSCLHVNFKKQKDINGERILVVVVLLFYVMSGRSVNLTTLFLGRL